MTSAECTKLLDEMPAAVAAAHDENWVHRDIKPANLLRHQGV